MRSSRKHFIQMLIFKHSFFSHPNHELNTPLMSHTLLSLSISIAVYHSLVFLISHPIHPSLTHPSPSVFLFSYIYLSTCVSASLPSLPTSFSPSPSFFMWFNNWCETFCLPSDVWGGLRDMTRLWRALCTTPDTHTHKNTHMDTHIYCKVQARVISVALMLQKRKCLVCMCVKHLFRSP